MNIDFLSLLLKSHHPPTLHPPGAAQKDAPCTHALKLEGRGGADRQQYLLRAAPASATLGQVACAERVDIVSIIDATGGLLSGRIGAVRLSCAAPFLSRVGAALHPPGSIPRVLGGSRGCVWRSAWGGGGA